MIHWQIKNTIISGISLVLFLAHATLPAFGFTQPSFSSCLNPQGNIQAPLTQGMHGIVGQNTQEGTDIVYTDGAIPESLVQCFCSNTGQGIQTNWWEATNLSKSDVQTLEDQGWIYVPDGSVWGLQAAPYLAQNSNFFCQVSSGTSSSASSTDNNTGTSSTSNNASSANNTNANTQQAVLGDVTQAVLGLAFTGNIILLYSLFSIGLLALLLGIFLSKTHK